MDYRDFPPELGSKDNPIIDSRLSLDEALAQNTEIVCPPEVLANQVLLTMTYMSFDGKYHKGQIVIHKDLQLDVEELFILMLEQNFPLESLIPLADPKFRFSDDAAMAANNSSAFNYRSKTGKDELSAHAHGRALDLNPRQNPYIKAGSAQPEGAKYDEQAPGTLTAQSPIVKFLEQRGWVWGGGFETLKDYHHFEKP